MPDKNELIHTLIQLDTSHPKRECVGGCGCENCKRESAELDEQEARSLWEDMMLPTFTAG